MDLDSNQKRWSASKDSLDYVFKSVDIQGYETTSEEIIIMSSAFKVDPRVFQKKTHLYEHANLIIRDITWFGT